MGSWGGRQNEEGDHIVCPRPLQGRKDFGCSPWSFLDICYLAQLFDEILVNAVDNKRRDPNTSRIDVVVKPGQGREPPLISITNDGEPIPVLYHQKESA